MEIYRFRYVDPKARVRYSVYGRTAEFADKLIERFNSVGIYKLRRCRLGYRKKVNFCGNPYTLEQEQERYVESIMEADKCASELSKREK